MTRSLPSEALDTSIAVLIFSVVCLTLSILLVSLLIKYGERSKYVTIFSAFTALSTLASIIQQIHFIANWKIVKQGHFENVMDDMRRHGIAFGGAGETWDLVLFYIQFYSHNVMCLNLLFWSMSLFNSSWATTFTFLGGRHHNLALFSKIFSIVWPSFIIAIMQIHSLQDVPILHIVSTFLTMFISLSLGSILTALVLFKYIRTRRLIAGHTSRGDWWGPSEIDSLSYNDDFSEGSIKDSSSIKEGSIFRSKIFNRMRHSIYDRALITRFTICFVIMAGFEVVIIFFTLYQVDSNAGIAASGQPDLSVDTAETEALLFLPGVTASLLAFCVFGTTKSWRAYRDLFSRGRGPRQKLSSPEALDFTILHQQQLN